MTSKQMTSKHGERRSGRVTNAARADSWAMSLLSDHLCCS